MKVRPWTLMISALLWANAGASAQAQQWRSCTFNGGARIQVRIVEMGDVFRLEWSDGPRMTYTRLDVGPDKPNIIDNLGGYWYWNSHRNGVGFNLYNPSNQNEITCYG